MIGTGEIGEGGDKRSTRLSYGPKPGGIRTHVHSLDKRSNPSPDPVISPCRLWTIKSIGAILLEL